jgi:hypothetical protein
MSDGPKKQTILVIVNNFESSIRAFITVGDRTVWIRKLDPGELEIFQEFLPTETKIGAKAVAFDGNDKEIKFIRPALWGGNAPFRFVLQTGASKDGSRLEFQEEDKSGSIN